MLSVLVVSPDPTVPGGVSGFIECMKRHLMHSRVDSLFVGSSGKGSESAFSTFKRLLGAPLKLVWRIKRERFDVVHINPSFDTKSLIRDGLLVLALRAVGFRRIMLYFHGWDFGFQRSILTHVFVRRVVAWVLNQSAVITVLGDSFRDGLVAIGVDPDHILVTRTMFEKDSLEAGGQASLRPFILFLSRFDREKGGRELIEAFAALAGDYPDLDLVMAGDGPDAEFLRAQAEKGGLKGRVTFPGYVTGSTKSRLLHGCRLFALPTFYRREGMPLAVLEAMGAGKPVLVGSAGTLRSIISEPENGIVLDVVSAETTEAGLRHLLSAPDFAAVGRRNAEIALTKFEASIVTPEIEKIYERVARC